MFGIQKKKQKQNLSDNILTIVGGDKDQQTIDGVNIISTGHNNRVIIHMDDCPSPFKNCNFLLAGNNCTIEIFPTKQPVHNLCIQFSDYVHNAIVRIGKSFGCQSANIIINDDGNNVYIGENCMFSWGIQIMTSDGHSIYDSSTHQLLNPSDDIVIGNHCWIGMGVSILKNVHLGDNIICGANATVTKSVNENNVIVAGFPATIVKRNINWHGNPPTMFNPDNLD